MATEEELSRRERKKLETRQRLMEAALRLFCDQGYDDTTVEQITDAADVAKSTFFNYFEAKETILPALAGWRLQQLGEALLPAQGAPASPVARIKLALRLVAQDPLIDPLLARRLFAAMMRRRQEGEKETKKEEDHPGRALTGLLAEQISQAQADGEIRADLDSRHLAFVIRAMFFQQLMAWHCGYRPAPLPEMLDAAVDLLLEGIAGPAWRHNG